MAGKREVSGFHLDAAVNGPITLDNCNFVGCSLGIGVRRLENRFAIRQIAITRSKANLVQIGPIRIQECSVESSAGTTEIVGWSTLFDRCVLKGKFGRVQLYDFHNVREPLEGGVNAIFRAANAQAYQNIDWALDITDASFSDLDIRSVPGEKVRVNGETQVVLNYTRCETAIADGKLDMSQYGDRILPIALKSHRFTQFNFVIATHKRQKHYYEMMDFFRKMQALGLTVDPGTA